MKKIWQQKIKELDLVIGVVNIDDTKRLKELFRKRGLLETAMSNCKG